MNNNKKIIIMFIAKNYKVLSLLWVIELFQKLDNYHVFLSKKSNK